MAESTPAPGHAPLEIRPDLRIQFENARFKFRVSAFAVDRGRLLVTRRSGADYCYVPGGKVGLGETSAEAMRRELREEVGLDLEIGALLAVAEALYTTHGEFRQDLNFCYPVVIPEGLDPEELTRRPEEGHDLEWVPIAELASAGFLPAGLIPQIEELIATADGTPRHLVMTD